MLVSPAEVVAKAKATIKECSVRDAQSCLTGATLLIDIREAREFEQGHLPGAIHISRGLLEFEILPAIARRGDITNPEDCDIVLYCGTGGRSALAARSLDAMGFTNVKSMDGGIVAWAEAKLPINLPRA